MENSQSDTRCTVLVVEDHADTAAVLLHLLKKFGYAATAVGSVDEAESRLDEINPDVVIVDVRLPDGEGRALLERLRLNRSLHAIAFTGLGSLAELSRGHWAGFGGHPTTPEPIDESDPAAWQVCRMPEKDPSN